jgi:uncharacterized protein (DUF1330 family)
MPHFLIAQVKVNDNSLIPGYAANVHDIVHRHGGRYLSRSGNITTLVGDKCTASLVAVIEFPTSDALHAFVSDPDCRPYAGKHARRVATAR